MWKPSGQSPSRDLSAPGDQFAWYAQACTGCHVRTMIYPGVFGKVYMTSICIVCQKRRRGTTRPFWYIQTAADLPQDGETLSGWQKRKQDNPGVFK